MFVDGELGGADGLTWVWSARGEKKSMSALTDTDVVTPSGATILLEGHRVYPCPTSIHVPGEILGSVRAASSSSHSFLKVLLATRQSGGRGAWWEFFGHNSCKSSSLLSI